MNARRASYAFARLAAGQHLQDLSYGNLIELLHHADATGSLQLEEAVHRELVERLHGYGFNPTPGAD